jgi:hypothetical protein
MPKKVQFGWTNRNALNELNNVIINLDNQVHAYVEQQMIIVQERQRIIDEYLYTSLFFSRHAGLYYNRYKNMDFEVMRIDFTNANPLIPRFTLIHVIDDPRDPDNVISITVNVNNFNMFR